MRVPTSVVAWLALAAALSTTACKARPADVQTASAPDASAHLVGVAKAKKGPAAPSAATGPMLAYTYRYVIEASADGVSGLSRREEQACVSAGPQVCQVLEASTGVQDGEVAGLLKLRAVPSWIAGFRAGLDGEVKGAGGHVTSQEIDTEDLSRQIVDTGAALRAKSMLRDRLEKLLAERPGKLEELVQLEKTVAEVQGEIDATQSELAAMQARVQMSELNLSYRTRGAALGPRAIDPLGHAFGGFFANVLGVSAVLVTVVSYLTPLALVVALGWSAVRWARRRRKPPARPPQA